MATLTISHRIFAAAAIAASLGGCAHNIDQAAAAAQAQIAREKAAGTYPIRQDDYPPPAPPIVDAMSPQEQFIQNLKQDLPAWGNKHYPQEQLESYSLADQAECRAQGNGAFGDLSTKTSVMWDCLRAKWYRGHPAKKSWPRRRTSPSPSRPVPNSANPAGSGTTDTCEMVS